MKAFQGIEKEAAGRQLLFLCLYALYSLLSIPISQSELLHALLQLLRQMRERLAGGGDLLG